MQGPDLLRRISAGSPQDLLTRIWARSCKDTERISQGPLQELLTRTWTRSCKGLFAQGIVKNLEQDLHARNPIRGKIVIKGPAAAGADLTRS